MFHYVSRTYLCKSFKIMISLIVCKKTFIRFLVLIFSIVLASSSKLAANFMMNSKFNVLARLVTSCLSSLSNDEVFPSLYLIDAIVESSKQLNPLKLLQKNYQNPLLWLLRGPVEQEFYIPSFCINLLICLSKLP